MNINDGDFGAGKTECNHSPDCAASFPPNDMTRRVKKARLEERKTRLRKRLDKISKDIELKEMAQRGLNDFYFFCGEIMGFKDLYEPLHRRICDFITSPERRKLLLVPRGHFKTTLASVCYPVWLLLRNCEERVSLTGLTARLALVNMRALKARIDSSRFQALYASLLPPTFTWPLNKAEESEIPRMGAKIGPSLYCQGVEASETGQHYSTIIIDDMVDDEKTRSRRQLDKIWDWFGRQFSVLDPDGQFLVAGTRWHWDDPYGRILDDKKNWSVLILEDIMDGKPIFPTWYPIEELEKIRQQQGDYRYSCFYKNNPSGEGVNPFDLRKFSFTDYRKEDNPEALTYIFIDPASTTKEWSCPSGFVVGDALPGVFVVRHASLKKLDPDDLVDKIIDYCRRFDPYHVIMETDSSHKAFLFWVRDKMREQELHYKVDGMVNPVTMSKETRTILELQPRLHEGVIVFDNNMKGKELILEEFSTFPKGRHDDLIQALAAVREVSFPRHHERKTAVELDRKTQIFNSIIDRGLKLKKKKRRLPRVRRNLWV